MTRNLDQTNVEEAYDLDPVEVTLTRAPVVKEEFLKMANELSDDELEELAKSFGLYEELAKGNPQKDEAPKEETLRKTKDQKPEDYEEEYAPPKKELEQKAKPSRDKAIEMAAKILSPYLPSLPAEIQKFFSKTPKSDDAEKYGEPLKKAILKSAFPELIEAWEKDLEATKERLQQLEAEKEFSEAVELAKSLGLPGDIEKQARRLISLRKALPEAEYKEFLEEQRGLSTIIQKSSLFTQVNRGGSGSFDPVAQIEALANEMLQKSDSKEPIEIRKAKAIETVLTTRPDLARLYHQEMSRRASMVREG